MARAGSRPLPVTLRRVGTLLVAGVLAVACGSPRSADDAAARAMPVPDGASGSGTVRVGSDPSAQSRLLAEIFATGLQIRGLHVEREAPVGDRSVTYPALRDGTLDVVPEYNGSLLRRVVPTATETDPDAVERRLRTSLPPDVRAMRSSEAQAAIAVTVPGPYAAAHHVRSLEDLAPLCGELSLGGPPDVATSAQGAPGLFARYGCRFRDVRGLDAFGPATVGAVAGGSVQAGELIATDPAVPTHDLVALDDPRATFTAENVVPLVATRKLSDPRIADMLNRIAAHLDTQVLTDLNRRVSGPDHPDPQQVARDWLASAEIG